MAFYKKLDTGEIASAGLFVYGINYTLTADNLANLNLPIDGWHWFETRTEAETKLNRVTRLMKSQAKLALAATPSAQYPGKSLYDLIEIYMSQPTTPAQHKIAWYDTQIFERDSPSLLLIAQMFQLTDEQIDELFALGATFETF